MKERPLASDLTTASAVMDRRSRTPDPMKPLLHEVRHNPPLWLVVFVPVVLIGGAAEMASAFSGVRKNRLDLSVGIALGNASQIELFVAPVLVLVSYPIGPAPMDLQFWPGAVVTIFIATLSAALVIANNRSAWFVGVLLLMVYLIFAMTLYLLPPQIP
jgi:Ca2+:H+ antiporter